MAYCFTNDSTYIWSNSEERGEIYLRIKSVEHCSTELTLWEHHMI